MLIFKNIIFIINLFNVKHSNLTPPFIEGTLIFVGKKTEKPFGPL